MRIEHVAIWVKDIEVTRNFYELFFDVKVNNKYINEKKGFCSYFLSFDNGARLEVMQKTSVLKREDITSEYMGYAHIAISVGSEEMVLNITENVRQKGYIIYSEPRYTGDGYFESIVLDPDGNKIEITV